MSNQSTASALPPAEVLARRRRARYRKDALTRWTIRAFGGGVVVALALIFVFLFIEVAPMLRGATIDEPRSRELPLAGRGATVALALERYGDLGARVSDSADIVFWNLRTDEYVALHSAPAPDGARVTSHGVGEPRTRAHAFGFDNGQVSYVEIDYDLTFPDDQRLLIPKLRYPLGKDALDFDPEGQAVTLVAVQPGSGGARGYVIAGYTEDGRFVVSRYTTRTSFMTGEVEVSSDTVDLGPIDGNATNIGVSTDLRHAYLTTDDGRILHYDIANVRAATLNDRQRALPDGVAITAMVMLNGSVSFIIGGEDGSVEQWMLVRDEDTGERRLTNIRSFRSHNAPVTAGFADYTRRSFVTADAAGTVALHHATASRSQIFKQVSEAGIHRVAVSPVNNQLLAQDSQGRLLLADMWNEHPDVSLRSMFNRVWYEGRSGPEYVWQSTAGADTFEPKMSLVPLTVGTLKAALFAMFFATPLAIAGAIYTAYFMAPKMRQAVKPTIELMEALPTVILGFLAGIWLAPLVEANLPGVFMIVFGLPIGFFTAALLWHQIPRALRGRIPEGWEALMLVPVVGLTVWLSLTLSPWMELWFFDGSMRQWFTDVGITYDQRNALVVGLAMGFAVIPTIFSIAEDAVFSVPKHLTQGSLALGATRWQTVTKVVLLTASPGIFAAVMIGFGRAVGETMIVLMATGNSPVVNFNIFEGMRTLSANVAVELGESSVGSTHYRVLFFSALVLFMLTFVVNTISEVVRQRLRKRYSNL